MVLSRAYFEQLPLPKDLEANIVLIKAFVEKHKSSRVALVTSGGILQKSLRLSVNARWVLGDKKERQSLLKHEQCGFSTISVQEHVVLPQPSIFLHKYSLEPYTRIFSRATNSFLEYIEETDDGDIALKRNYTDRLKQTLRAYKKATDWLLRISFVSVSEYLFYLKASAQIIGKLEQGALFYLAAAVSDFFIPLQDMAEHKFQSDKDNLVLRLRQVPKLLKPLVNEWAPQSFIVSFKLETDEELLLPKARAALVRYGHHLVIGNLLQNRKRTVVFVTSNTNYDITLSECELEIVDIEYHIVAEVKRLHTAFCA